MIIEIYHLVRTQTHSDWTIAKTAEDFQISIGLASESLRLARAMHKMEGLIDCETRQDALNKLKSRGL